MFRRRTTAEGETAGQQPGPGSGAAATASRTKPQGKGRPTPKRRDAEKQRRQPIRPPRDRKDAYRQTRKRQREQRRKMRQGMAQGDERFFPPRDQGSVRRLARDYVDSRRSLGEFFLILTLAILVLGFVPQFTIIAYNLLWPLMMAVIVGESFLTARRIRRMAEQRYPDESTRGLGFYAAMRSLQMRRLRLPPPRVKVGEKI